MNIACWCLPSAILVESSTLPGATLLRNTVGLSMFYRNLGTLLKFVVIPYSAGTWTLAEQSLCFVFAYKEIPQIWPSCKHLKGKNPQQFLHEHKKKKQNKTLETSQPVNSCYQYMNHTHLIGICFLAQGYGGKKKVCFSFFSGIVILGVWNKHINVALDLSTLPESQSSSAVLTNTATVFSDDVQLSTDREKPLSYLLLVPWVVLTLVHSVSFQLVSTLLVRIEVFK